MKTCFPNALNTTIEKLASRTPSVEMLRDGGYNIRELAFNNRLQGCVTNPIPTTNANGTVTISTNVTIQGTADQRLQQLFSVVQAVETARQAEQTERARAVSLYLQWCLVSTNAPNANVITMLQGEKTPSSISNSLSNKVHSPTSCRR
jgi:hypothetical protein